MKKAVLLQSCKRRAANPNSGRLGRDRELRCDEGALRAHVIGWNRGDLTFADHRKDLITGNDGSGRAHRLEAKTRPNQPLDPTMILLNNIVEILDLAQARKARHLSRFLHRFGRAWIGGVLADRDRSRLHSVLLLQCFPKEASSSGGDP